MPRSPVRAAAALTLLSAGLYAALLPPLSLAPLAWIALVPFLVACARVPPSRAAVLGLLWTLAGTLLVAWWFPSMLERFFGVSPAAAWFGMLGLGVLINGAPYAAFAALVSWLARRGRATPLIVAAAWGLAEYARANGWIANPFALLAYSQYGTPVAQLADLAGPYGIGMLIAFVAAALGGVAMHGLRGRRPLRDLVLAGLAIAAAYGYGTVRLGQTFGEGEPVRVALVQGDIARGLEWDRGKRDANLDTYIGLTRSLAVAQPEVVFWPEFAVDFYLRERSAWRERLFANVRAIGADFVVGAGHYEFGARRTHYYNSVFVIDRAGRVADRFDKTRLVPFSEYGPLGSWLRARSAIYDAGAGPHVLTARRARVGAFVCGEALFPDVARAQALAGAEILANPSNDYWFGHPAALAHQFQIASLRAIENRRYLVRPTATGVSAVIDPHGRPLVRSAIGEPAVLEAEVRRSRATTLYQQTGDAAIAVALAVVILGSVPRELFFRGGV
jgi:apolipoprotein N-acyltransferase